MYYFQKKETHHQHVVETVIMEAPDKPSEELRIYGCNIFHHLLFPEYDLVVRKTLVDCLERELFTCGDVLDKVHGTTATSAEAADLLEVVQVETLGCAWRFDY